MRTNRVRLHENIVFVYENWEITMYKGAVYLLCPCITTVASKDTWPNHTSFCNTHSLENAPKTIRVTFEAIDASI